MIGAAVATRSPAAPARRSGRSRLRVPLALLVAVAAFLNAACWSVVTPPFQVTDEEAHVAYVKQLAETGRLPGRITGTFPREETVALEYLHSVEVQQYPAPQPVASQPEQDALERALRRAARLPRDGADSAGVATAEPPLYYAIEAVPYLLASRGTLLDRIELMRLVSALMAGFTALFAFLFAREALPAAPWAWTTAGFGVALTPLLGFMSGAVNPDSLLYAVSGALFFCLARAFRRGLTDRLAAAIGAVLAIGLLTKLNFIGLLPGAGVGLALLCLRVARHSRRAAARRLAIAGSIAAVPVLLALAVGILGRHGGSLATDNIANHGSPIDKLQYAWQLYLPRLPGMVDDFPDISTARQIWFDGFLGVYGWAYASFPGSVENLALVPAAAIACLCAAAVFARRRILGGRAAELGVYALIAAGLMLMIAIVSYPYFPSTGAEFGRTRYLFPLLAPFGAVLALAARGAGRRWGPAVGVLIVMLMLAHDLFSQLLVVARYYRA
jgi:4-amino-4-deoxy-L-arabinose transferase-like glycosyltransferase